MHAFLPCPLGMLLFSQASLNRFTTPSGRIERIEALDAKPLMYYRWVERNAVVLCGAAGAGFWRVYLGGGSDALPVDLWRNPAVAPPV